jgi:hypothetical protein
MAADDPIVLSEWPEQLNGKFPMKNGFEMAFQSDSDFMASQPVRFFFPWGPFDANATLRWAPGIRFNQAITNAPLGDLIDDIGNFWENPGDEDHYEYRYIRLHRLPDGRVETTPQNWRGTLEPNDALEGAIRDHIASFHSKLESDEEDPNHISLGLIASVACEKILALHEEFRALEGRDPEWKATLRRRIAEFNGPINGFETEAISQLYYVTGSLSAENREKCFGLIKEARAEVIEAISHWDAGPNCVEREGEGADDDQQSRS